MKGNNSDRQAFCWSLDIPDMTEVQGVQVASIIEKNGLNLEPILVNPAIFLTLHIDRESAEAIRAALLVQSNLIGHGLREVIEEWLETTKDQG